MKIGLYLDLRRPLDADPRAGWSRLYSFMLEVCEEAERLGIHSVWLTEHHLFADGYLPQPLSFAAAIAARTSQLRIGTGVLIAPFRHPVHVAEEVAVLDNIAAGRFELGVGAGYRGPEFDLFGADVNSRYDTTDEFVRTLRRLWSDDTVTPHPVQARVPVWMGYQGLRGARRVGRLGEGLLSVKPNLLQPYLDGLMESGNDPSRARMAGPVSAWVCDDPDRDWEQVKRYLAYQFDSYRAYLVEGTGRPPPRPVDVDQVRGPELAGPLEGFFIGTPAEVAAKLDRHRVPSQVQEVFLWASIGGMPEEMVRRHVAAVGRLVPLVAD